MNTLSELLEEYGSSHQHPVNKIIHWICVPLIVFSLLGLLWLLPFPDLQFAFLEINFSSLFLIFALLYYALLSWRLTLGMLFYSLVMYLLLWWLDTNGQSLLSLYVGVFVLAWVGQFIGHHIEQKRPSFLRDIQFLLIGPLWLLAAIYRKLNIPYE